jgi:hypothetical protein
MGLYYWLIGRPKKALTWWAKSIETAGRLGARPELARTFMEVGKRLLEEKRKGKPKQLSGIKAEEYLKKARILFQDMELAWDLQELNKVENPESRINRRKVK